MIMPSHKPDPDTVPIIGCCIVVMIVCVFLAAFIHAAKWITGELV